MEEKVLMYHLRYFLSTPPLKEGTVSQSFKCLPTFFSILVFSIQGAKKLQDISSELKPARS